MSKVAKTMVAPITAVASVLGLKPKIPKIETTPTITRDDAAAAQARADERRRRRGGAANQLLGLGGAEAATTGKTALGQ